MFLSPITLEAMIAFWRAAAKLKTEKRKGWKKLSLTRPESVADHSYATAMLALFEGERRGWNVGAMIKLGLLHDLEEAITGDLTPEDKERLGSLRVRRERERAIRRLLQTFPPNSRARYMRLWMDLRLGRTREARLVHQLDKIELALQAHAYSKSGNVTDFYHSAATEIEDIELRRILESIRSPRQSRLEVE